MGGSDWHKTKGKARRYVKQIAAELIQRSHGHLGHAFAPDTPWQRELEDAFAYVETPDQLSSIDEVKADMERSVPMDRLICGDVGYGKTEIAVRAAFKAIQDGKQVAVLVPTTLLVQQHFQTFSERYAQFPVVVKALSRFQSDKETPSWRASPTAASTSSSARTDCCPRTSATRTSGWSSSTRSASVSSTRQLKTLRTAVDVLAMSATPIPRTLEMAVTGIREMSTLATPPEERHPVLTYVGAYEEKQITAAIRRELLREGQSSSSTTRSAASRGLRRASASWCLRPAWPRPMGRWASTSSSRSCSTSGTRSSMLVCTTIVETGLDISNANTLIVERADVLGLSQLHQLRGRVGRGRERAYCYFLYPPEKPMTETAHDRLQTMASHTDLGAGIQIAMKDLEIRGAGNLLGGEQSGHIAGVGFDLYVRLVGRRGRLPRRGETAPAEIKIELPVDAHLPHDYVPGERLRLEAYKKLASVVDEAQLAGGDRGRARRPLRRAAEPVRNLLEVARLRTVARQGRGRRHQRAGQPCAFRAGRPARGPGSSGCSGCTRSRSSRTRSVPSRAQADDGTGGWPTLRDTAVLQWASDLIRAVMLGGVGDAARVAAQPARAR